MPKTLKTFLLEYNRVKALQGLGAKFEKRAKQDGLTPEQAITRLEQGDPTKNHQYVNWLARAYQNGSKLKDLLSRGKDNLTKFETLKRKKLLKPEQADIGKLQDLRAFEDVLDEYEMPETSAVDKGRADIVIDGPEVRVVEIKDFKAACYYGQGTRWCTAAKSNNMYDHYKKDGLWVFLPKHPKYKGEKYQLSLGSSATVADEKDDELDWDIFLERFPGTSKQIIDLVTSKGVNYISLHHPEELEMVLDKHHTNGILNPQDAFKLAANLGQPIPKYESAIAKDPEAAYDYASDIIGGRWPKGEAAIAKDPHTAYGYAIYFIKGEWKKGEEAIASDPETTHQYINTVIRGRWRPGEDIIKREVNLIQKLHGMDVLGVEYVDWARAYARKYKLDWFNEDGSIKL